MIPYGRQWIDDDDIAAVVETLRGEWLTQGPAVERFEGVVAEYCGADHAVAVANGTAALHAAAYAAGLGPGKLLWTSPNTFAASANCARYLGADVDFVDIDDDTWCMSIAALEERLAASEKAGRLPDVVVPVHFAGQPCEMSAIGALAERYGFAVVEDAAHAIGASLSGVRVGACRQSAMTTFSFHPVKIVTTAEGGMVTTNDESLADRLRLFRHHGITRDERLMEHASEGGWYYEQIDLGYNYRITDLQSALGISQMSRIDEFVERRERLASRYSELLAELPLRLPTLLPGRASAWHLFVVRVTGSAGVDRTALYDSLKAAGIGANVHYIPVHLHPYYRRLGFGPGDFPVAERYYSEAITLPLYPSMSDEQQDHVVRAITEALA